MTEWRYVPFSSAVADRSAGNTKVLESDYSSAGVLAIVDQGSKLIAGYTNDTDAAYKGKLPVIVFGDHTRIFKYVDFPFALGADGVKVLQPSDDFDCKFLYYFFSSLDIPSAGYSRHFKFLKEFEVLQPPLDEQKRMAGLLDKAEMLRLQRQRAISLIDELTASTFLDMFGSPITNPMGWKQCPIGKLGRVVTGNTPSRSDAGNYGDSIEWIKSDNIDSANVYLTLASEHLSERGRKIGRIADVGSVLVTCIAGTPASIGNVAIADRQVAFNQQINAIMSWEMAPEFLYMQLRLGKSLVQEKSTGGMKGLVSKSRFESILLMAPPRELQLEFSRRMKSFGKQKAAYRLQLKELKHLFSSLRHWSFEGKILPIRVTYSLRRRIP